jgi:hypothetical protein
MSIGDINKYSLWVCAAVNMGIISVDELESISGPSNGNATYNKEFEHMYSYDFKNMRGDDYDDDYFPYYDDCCDDCVGYDDYNSYSYSYSYFNNTNSSVANSSRRLLGEGSSRRRVRNRQPRQKKITAEEIERLTRRLDKVETTPLGTASPYEYGIEAKILRKYYDVMDPIL